MNDRLQRLSLFWNSWARGQFFSPVSVSHYRPLIGVCPQIKQKKTTWEEFIETAFSHRFLFFFEDLTKPNSLLFHARFYFSRRFRYLSSVAENR